MSRGGGNGVTAFRRKAWGRPSGGDGGRGGDVILVADASFTLLHFDTTRVILRSGFAGEGPIVPGMQVLTESSTYLWELRS
jgi:GTP-binding protein